MSSKRKSTCETKSKRRHHSRSHRHQKSSNGNTREFIEPIYFLDSMLSHSNNNTPLFSPTPFYDPSQSTWNPVPPIGSFNSLNHPLLPNINHPTQLTIGPLYLLAEGKKINENSIILEGAQSNSINENISTRKNNLHQRLTNAIKNENPGSANVAGENYILPSQNEEFDVINKWKSQNCSKYILINTPNQYGYETPPSNRMVSCRSNRWPLQNCEGIYNASDHSPLQSNELLKELPENKSGDIKKDPGLNNRGDLTVMRVDDWKEINQDVKTYDRNSPQTSQDSKSSDKKRQLSVESNLQPTVRWSDATNDQNVENHNQIYNKLPIEMNDLNKERNDFRRYDPRDMNIRGPLSKRLNCNRCSRVNGKNRKFRGMTTEDSINDLYRKIHDIESSLEASQGLPLRKVNTEVRPMAYSVPLEQSVRTRQVPHYDNDMAVQTTTRGVSPINFRTVQNTISCHCTCCQQFEIGLVERVLNSPNLIRDIETLPQFSSNPTQLPGYCHGDNGYPNDRIQYSKMHCPQSNIPFQPDIDLVRVQSSPQINENGRIVSEQEDYQSPFFSQNYSNIQEMCSRPCYCPQNTVPDSCTKTVIHRDPNVVISNGFPAVRLCPLTPPNLNCSTANEKQNYATKDNSILCTSPELPPKFENQFHNSRTDESDESRSVGVQMSIEPNILSESQNSFEQVQPCLCPPNFSKPCNCDFSKELNDIMEKIEDSIILKLERKNLLVADRSMHSAAIQDPPKRILNDQVQNTESESMILPTRLEESRITPSKSIVTDPNNSVLGKNHVIREQSIVEPKRSVSLKEPPRSFIPKDRPRELMDSGLYIEQIYSKKPDINDASVDTNDLREPMFESSRKFKFSSYMKRRNTKGTRKEPLLYSYQDPEQISTNSTTNSRNSTRRSVSSTLSNGYRRSTSPSFINFQSGLRIRSGSSLVDSESSLRISGSALNNQMHRINHPRYSRITQVLTATPNVENELEKCKDKTVVLKDYEPSDKQRGNNKISWSDTKVDKKKKVGTNHNSYRIRRIKLPGRKKHIYILVKKRHEENNTSSQESFKRQGMFNISAIKANYLRGISAEKISFSKDIKSKRFCKFFMKSNKQRLGNRNLTL